jgi:glycosyltransferase involved in cell wall biosynthesis
MTDSVSDSQASLSMAGDRPAPLRVVYLAAGAAGMYCGSCMRDNRLAATLIGQGHDVVLLPLYTPLKTDEHDVSVRKIHYGGINVYLDQLSRGFRRLPAWSTRFLDSPWVLGRIARFASRTRADELGPLTVSVLAGEHGPQRRELESLLRTLAEMKPAIVNLPNLMFIGVARRIREELDVPVVCTLSGEDIFLDALPESYRRQSFDLIRERAGDIDGYVAVTSYFADHAAEHFGLPRDRIHVIPMGINANQLGRQDAPVTAPFNIGYLGRVCPEKGLALLADAFIRLRRDGRDCRLRAAGYLAAADRMYLKNVKAKIDRAGFGADFDYLGEVTLEQKRAFLQSTHVLSVPTLWREAKGFYVLEALACGVPVVQPRHGSFPELIETTGGGLLFEPGDADALAGGIAKLMDDPSLREHLALKGYEGVRAHYDATIMADRTWALYEELVLRR